jgi:hypothetical protein
MSRFGNPSILAVCTACIVSFLAGLSAHAQIYDAVYSDNIKTPQLYVSGNQLAYPIIRLNTGDQLELHFDDLDADVKNYYYALQICNVDWTPALVSDFDYVKGFPQRISDYQFSSVALTRYTHYQAVLPVSNYMPIRSGNYILKVYLDGDTSKLAFTRRLLVTDARVSIRSQLLQPLDYMLTHTHQRIQFTLNTSAVNPANPLDQIKVVVLQDYRWDNAIRDVRPTFYINNTLEYKNDNDFVFAGGNEWRWLDLQTFRYQSDRIQNANYGKTSTEIFVRPDMDRSRNPYYFYKDYNGFYFIQTTENINPVWQTDYARVRFNYMPAGNTPFPDRDIYILGQFTGGRFNDSTRMVFNTEKGRYEASFLLKQGYYSYSYVTVDRNDPDKKPSFDVTEGNHVETENDYMILVYYRAPGSRMDELVGISRFNSLNK